MFVVRLDGFVGKCWLAPWGGDPGRTVVLANAKRYKTERGAKAAATIAKKKYSWRKIGVVEPAPETLDPSP